MLHDPLLSIGRFCVVQLIRATFHACEETIIFTTQFVKNNKKQGVVIVDLSICKRHLKPPCYPDTCPSTEYLMIKNTISLFPNLVNKLTIIFVQPPDKYFLLQWSGF